MGGGRSPPPPGKSHGQLTLIPTTAWSDNNHFARFDWYKRVIASLVKLDRAPEDPLMKRANDWCRSNGQRGDGVGGLYIYGEWNVIAHLDGRHNTLQG